MGGCGFVRLVVCVFARVACECVLRLCACARVHVRVCGWCVRIVVGTLAWAFVCGCLGLCVVVWLWLCVIACACVCLVCGCACVSNEEFTSL